MCPYANVTYLNEEVDEIGIRLEFGADGAQELNLFRLGGSRLNLTACPDQPLQYKVNEVQN